MPELPEIHNFARLIEKQAGRRFNGIEQVSMSPPKWPAIDPHNVFGSGGFYVSAVPRGKELQLTLKASSGETASYVFNHGLEGKWLWFSAGTDPKCMIKFVAEDGGQLCLVDNMRMATWREGTFDTKKRGPDPLLDPVGFVNNVRAHLHTKKDFVKPIAEVLLDQAYFNGIGNYLRAEVLARACVSPHQKAVEVLSGPKADLVFALCNAIPQEVLDLGLNKYGTVEEKAKFQDWLTCYGKAQSEKDHGGRTMWYFPNQASRQPTPKDLVYQSAFKARLNSGISTSTASSVQLLPHSFPSQQIQRDVHTFQQTSNLLIHQPRFQLSAEIAQSFSGVLQPSVLPHSLIAPGLLSLASVASAQRSSSAPAPSAALGKVPETTKLLMLVSILFKENKISTAEKNLLKEIVIGGRGAGGRSWLTKLEACLEYFEAENDLDEVAETLQILSRHYQQRA